jgi:fermentation-respiration switch protein FrsA (DUF1100 family)
MWASSGDTHESGGRGAGPDRIIRKARRGAKVLDAQLIMAAAAVAAGAVLLVAVVWTGQRRLIYFPLQQDVPPVATALPGATEVNFETDDGLRLGGWFLAAAGSENSATMLVFNGNAGDRSFRAPLAADFSRAGLSVLLFDYRGYGHNPGTPSEAGLLMDSRAARAYLAGRGDIDPDRIVYFGESLGAAVAVALAAEQPPAALILRSPFTSLADMGRLHYPFLPVIGFLLRDRFDSIEQITRVRCPVLIIAGDKDQIVPLAHSRRLYEAAHDPKQFELVPGADHNDPELLTGSHLIDRVVRFAAELVERDQTQLARGADVP